MRRGPQTTLAAVLAAAVALAATGSSGAVKSSSPVRSFAFAIGNGTLKGSPAEVGARYAGFDLVVVDGEEASPQEVAEIADNGVVVLAYLSVGTIEGWRGWYDRLRPYRLKAWQDWKDEWFADTSRPAFRNRLTAIAEDSILTKGFGGLFLDNTDMVETRSHRDQRAGMARLIGMLDEAVEPGPLYTQNGAPGMLDGYPRQGVDPLIDHFQGWNREDVTWTFDFDDRTYVRTGRHARKEALSELEQVGASGLLTSATDYVELRDGVSPAECKAVANANGAGALDYVGDIGLTRRAVAANPPDC